MRRKLSPDNLARKLWESARRKRVEDATASVSRLQRDLLLASHPNDMLTPAVCWEVARALNTVQPAASRAIARLVRRGMLERVQGTPSKRAPRGRHWYVLTDKGRTLRQLLEEATVKDSVLKTQSGLTKPPQGYGKLLKEMDITGA